MDRLSAELVHLVGSHLPLPSLVAFSETSRWLRYCVEPLLQRELSRSCKRNGLVLLDTLLKKNNISLTRKLLSPPCSVHTISSGNDTTLLHLLQLSVCLGSVEFVKMLIDEFGADPYSLERRDGLDAPHFTASPEPGHGLNAIHLAAQAGQVSVAELLLSRGIPITATYTYRAGPNLGRARNNTAMDAAARAGHASFVEFLLKQNIEWPLDDSIVLALEEGHIGVLQTLLDAGASLDKIDDPSQELYYAFLHACNAGHTEAIRWVFDHGARFPPTTTNYGFVNGPLLSALRANRPNRDVVSTLIEHGGGSPLVISNAKEIVDELVKVAKEARRDLSSVNDASDSESGDRARRIRRTRNRARGRRARNEPELWKGNPAGARRFHALCDIVPLLLANGLDADLLASELQQPDIPDSIAREMTQSAY
ncbi:ANK-REP-REGION domain-containing protein [Mycena chlorophos]|uniref:ANK-REP-REGION domain-containing protein n=1 Tax=Mycena chlorophos TaxID=658473 RepID=A0A8H6T2A8_MYCCL|nr:ANK-REP-REGION domain-containing protein [Mycena chlorophos]